MKLAQENYEVIKKRLEEGNRVNIALDEQETASLEYIQFKEESYNNLFTSYINRTREEADKFNLQKFLDIYTANRLEMRTLLDMFLENYLGEELYKFVLDNNKRYGFNQDLKGIFII